MFYYSDRAHAFFSESEKVTSLRVTTPYSTKKKKFKSFLLPAIVGNLLPAIAVKNQKFSTVSRRIYQKNKLFRKIIYIKNKECNFFF